MTTINMALIPGALGRGKALSRGERAIRSLLVSIFGAFLGGWWLMLAIGILHGDWWHTLPTMGYWTSVIVVGLLRAAFLSGVADAMDQRDIAECVGAR